MSRAEGQDGLGFYVSPAAGERLRAFTTAHVGARLAFVIDNRVRMVSKILDPLKGDAFWLSPFPIAEGTAFSERVNACIKDR